MITAKIEFVYIPIILPGLVKLHPGDIIITSPNQPDPPALPWKNIINARITFVGGREGLGTRLVDGGMHGSLLQKLML